MDNENFVCNSFVFYASFYEAIRELPPKEQQNIVSAIMVYAFENVEIDLKGTTKALFLLIKPQLNANRVKYTNGKKGGAPTGNNNAKKTIEKQPKTTSGCFDDEKQNNLRQPVVVSENNLKQPNVNVNANANVNENENVNANGVGCFHETTQPEDGQPLTGQETFVKPTLSEVEKYCSERKNSVDARRFFAYYDKKNWRTGRQAIRDWKALLQSWEEQQSPPLRTADVGKYERGE